MMADLSLFERVEIHVSCHPNDALVKDLAHEVGRLSHVLSTIVDGYGPNHLSKFARDTAKKALTQ